jgi:hypothetical protein
LQNVNSNVVSIVSLLYSHLTKICLMVCFGLSSSAKCDATHFRFFPLSFQVSLRVRFCCTVNRSFGVSIISGRLIPSIWSSPGSYRNEKLIDYSVYLYLKINPWRLDYFDTRISTYICIWFVDLWNLLNIHLNIIFQILKHTQHGSVLELTYCYKNCHSLFPF